jgi:hypothetical protein
MPPAAGINGSGYDGRVSDRRAIFPIRPDQLGMNRMAGSREAALTRAGLEAGDGRLVGVLAVAVSEHEE